MADQNQKIIPTISEYKKNPILVLPLDDQGKYTFSFGLSKAKIILKFIENIKKFVASEGKEL